MTGLHLVDTSAWAQRLQHPQARERLDTLVNDGTAATCLAVCLESLYQVRNAAEFDVRRDALRSSLTWLAAGADVEDAAIEIMGQLVAKGQHRRPIPDITIAAVAMVHGATIVHYDNDFEQIAEVTGQPHEWIVPRGSGHGRHTG